MPDFMNPSADLQAGIAAGWAEGQRQIENMQDEIEHLEKELDDQRARAQRLEATLVLTEDQRDKALKERDDVQRLSIERAAEYIAMLGKINAGVDAVIAQRDKAQSQRDSFLADLERVVAERDAAIAERNDARTMCKNQAETWLNALAESTAKLKTAIAERNALRKQLDDLRHDYTDKSYWGKK